MSRYALLIDAGYLLSGGGQLCAGTGIRSGLECSVEELLDGLIEFADEHCGEDLLRVYWYDGAKDAVPNTEHLKIGALARVKVRLGRLTYSGQKGVDSRIVRDLMTLARNRAITTAYLLSGDEDLREGVADAQEAGVRVMLFGIPPANPKTNNQSFSLIREADEHIVFPTDFWSQYIRLRSDLTTIEIDPEFAKGKTQEAVIRKVGELFAASWANEADTEELYSLADQHPRISRELDADLLVVAQRAFGKRVTKELRNELRKGFWNEILDSVALLDAESLGGTEAKS